MEGKIVRLVAEKKFGFIQAGKEDYFFHQSALKNARFEDLSVGQEVTFEDEESDRGKRAADVYA